MVYLKGDGLGLLRHARERKHFDFFIGGDDDEAATVAADGQVGHTLALQDGLWLAPLYVPGDELLVVAPRHEPSAPVQPALDTKQDACVMRGRRQSGGGRKARRGMRGQVKRRKGNGQRGRREHDTRP